MNCMICAGILSNLRSDRPGEIHSPTGKLDESRCVRDQILRDLWLITKRMSWEQSANVQRLRSRLYNLLL
jgi:hypothetical protein